MTDRTIAALDDQLRDARLRSRREIKLRRDAATLEARVEERRASVAEMEDRLSSELADVEKLTSTSIQRFIAVVRGDVEERLAAEEAEVIAAATALANERDQLGIDEERLAAVREELAALGDPSADLERLRREKERAVGEDTAIGSALAEIAERRSRIVADLREVDEAIEAGERSRELLGRAADMLRSAGGWSTWDVLGGGGLVTLQKHGRLRDARQAGSAAAAALTRFEDELADVRADVAAAPSVELTGLDFTFDFWFDNIFTDVRIDGKIRRSQRRTDQVTDQVRSVLHQLRIARAELVAEEETLASRRDALLEPPASPGERG